jgi:hypothetical protein
VLDDSLLDGDGAVRKYTEFNSKPGRAALLEIYTSCDRLARPDLTFFLCRERDDITALMASKG